MDNEELAKRFDIKFNELNSKMIGMQGALDGLRTLMNSTCDRVSALEKRIDEN